MQITVEIINVLQRRWHFGTPFSTKEGLLIPVHLLKHCFPMPVNVSGNFSCCGWHLAVSSGGFLRNFIHGQGVASNLANLGWELEYQMHLIRRKITNFISRKLEKSFPHTIPNPPFTTLRAVTFTFHSNNLWCVSGSEDWADWYMRISSRIQFMKVSNSGLSNLFSLHSLFLKLSPGWFTYSACRDWRNGCMDSLYFFFSFELFLFGFGLKF